MAAARPRSGVIHEASKCDVRSSGYYARVEWSRRRIKMGSGALQAETRELLATTNQGHKVELLIQSSEGRKSTI